MSRDPENGPDAAPTPDHDPDATQAWVPTFDDDTALETVEPTGPEWSAESLLPLTEVTAPVTKVTPAAAASATDEPSAIDLLFGEERFEEVPETEQPLLALPALTRRGGADADASEGAELAPEARAVDEAQRTRILIGVVGGVFTLLLGIAMFLLGARIPEMANASSPITVTASPAPTDLGPVEPGAHAWNELRGGECLEPFSDPWAEEFTVVDCAEPHTAQLTLHAPYAEVFNYRDEDGTLLTPAFPGVEVLAGGIDSLCAVALDFEAARDITDGVMQGTFPTSFEEWQADPSYSCFFSRASGAALTGSVAPVAESDAAGDDD